MVRHWLMKSEPGAYSIHDLERDGTTHWDGVRNYEARNHMQAMSVGDLAIFYHSSAKPTGAAGVMKVVREAYPDHTAFDPKDKHFDAKSDPDAPRWFMVDVAFDKAFAEVVELATLREHPALADSDLVTRKRQPSVQALTPKQFKAILDLAG